MTDARLEYEDDFYVVKLTWFGSIKVPFKRRKYTAEELAHLRSMRVPFFGTVGRFFDESVLN